VVDRAQKTGQSIAPEHLEELKSAAAAGK